MENDTLYRMITALVCTIPTLIIVGLFWPRNSAQKYYKDPIPAIMKDLSPSKKEPIKEDRLPIDPIQQEGEEEEEQQKQEEEELQQEGDVYRDEEHSHCSGWEEDDDEPIYVPRVCLLCQLEKDPFNGTSMCITEMINEHYDSTDNVALAKMMYDYHSKDTGNSDTSDNGMIGMIIDHLDGHHSFHAREFMAQSIRSYRKVSEISKLDMFRDDGTVDRSSFEMFNRSQEALENIYKLPVDMINK